jgi:DNA polymerase-4
MYTEGTMLRKIVHLDLDAFFCAVEINEDPALQGKAFAVGGRPEERGVVASCSYPARMFGVRSALPMGQAVRLCPELIIIPNRHGLYEEISAKVMAALRDLTPAVEQISIDEAFLDASLLQGDSEAIAQRLQATVNTELKLPASLGVATNKLVAKIANNVGKSAARSGQPPNAITVVPPGEEAAFLAPLPIRELWGVGPRTAERLEALGLHTIGDIARWPQDDLVRRFGKQGQALALHARGLDERPVVVEHETKSISQEVTFTRDVGDSVKLHRTLRSLADGVGRRLRQANLSGKTVHIKLRWTDFTTLTRQSTLAQPTDQDNAIYEAAAALFDQNWPLGKPVRLLGVGISGFTEPNRQLGLWEDPGAIQEERRLQSTLDALRDRFGDDAIQRGSSLRPPRRKPSRKSTRRDRPPK